MISIVVRVVLMICAAIIANHFLNSGEIFLGILLALFCASSAKWIIDDLIAFNGILYVFKNSKELKDVYERECKRLGICDKNKKDG